MSYEMKSRIRYSELGPDRVLTLPALVDLLQDCCTFQSESIGQGMNATEKRQRAWILSSWQVVIARYPGLGEEVIATTIPYEFRGIFGMRNFTLDTAKGERLAWANSCWVNVSTATGQPARLTQEDMAGYVLDEKLDMDYAPRKILLPQTWESLPPIQVRPRHLDTHRHVNNCQYVRMAADYLPEGKAVSQLRVEYKHVAVEKNMLYPLVHLQEDTLYVAFNRSEAGDLMEPYACLEMKLV